MEIKETRPKRYDSIPTILGWIAGPRSIAERKERYVSITTDIPFIKEVIDASFYPTASYSQMLEYADEGDLDRLHYYSEVDAVAFWQKEIHRFTDAYTRTDGKRKWEQLIQIFSYMKKDDALFLLALMKGEYAGPKKINQLFLKAIDKENELGKA